MDIISTAESSALNLEYNQNVEAAQNLRKDVLRALKLNRSTKVNLSKQQRIALKEICEDNDIKIYPFLKGSGLVRMKSEEANNKIREQIGNTKILNVDPTPSFAVKVINTLSYIN